MIKSLFLVLALICALSSSAEYSLRRVSPFGIVEGITDCGSAGQLGIVTITDCTQVPCTFVPGSVYDIAIRYIASVTSETLRLLVYKIHEGLMTPILTVPIIGTIEAGREYELTFQLPVALDLTGTEFNLRFYIFDSESFAYELCAQAAIIVS